MYNSSPGLYALDVSGIFGCCDNQKYLPTLPDVFWGTKSPLSVWKPLNSINLTELSRTMTSLRCLFSPRTTFWVTSKVPQQKRYVGEQWAPEATGSIQGKPERLSGVFLNRMPLLNRLLVFIISMFLMPSYSVLFETNFDRLRWDPLV